MDYKEKLKAIINSNKTPFVDIDTFLKYFPELKESEDERTRKSIIELLNEVHFTFKYYDINKMLAWLENQGSLNTNQNCLKGIKRVQEYQDLSNWEKEFDNIASMYAYNRNQEGYNDSWYVKERAAEMLYHAKKELEKQGEQKPAEWSDEDYVMQRAALEILMASPKTVASTILKESVIEWLKHLKDRVQPQPKQEWSEEDEKLINSIIELIDNGALDRDEKDYFIEKLKSLRPQTTWKPSDEQMTALRRAKNAVGGEGEIYGPLNSLYEDLKKLKD